VLLGSNSSICRVNFKNAGDVMFHDEMNCIT
jgi:hypothetical protein